MTNIQGSASAESSLISQATPLRRGACRGSGGFGSTDESETVMYPCERIEPKDAGRVIGTVAALIEAGYGGGTPETVRIFDDFPYPDGRDGVAIALAPRGSRRDGRALSAMD